MTMVTITRAEADHRAGVDCTRSANNGRAKGLAVMEKQVVGVTVAVAVVLKRMIMNQGFYSKVDIPIRAPTGFAHAGESETGGGIDATAGRVCIGQWKQANAWTAYAHAKIT